MQPPISFSCDSSSSWIFIGVFKPRRFSAHACCSSEELVDRITLISLSFNRFAKTAVLKSRTSNHVVIFSVWDRSTKLDLGQVSWYEISCCDCKEMATPAPTSSLSSSCISTSLLAPPLVQEDVERSSQPLPISASMESVHANTFYNCREDMSSSPPSMASSPSSSPSHSLAAAVIVHLSRGDVVHLRCITSGRHAHLQDALPYSCLAILKAYFPQTEGLLSYTFFRSLDGSRMAGLGVWQGMDAASAFLDAPGGACEERFWRSMGAKARLQRLLQNVEIKSLIEMANLTQFSNGLMLHQGWQVAQWINERTCLQFINHTYVS
ncbi:hypothetical protein GOP47_0004288 [Adiantum capillus-veneris]|uniref:DUF7392 domain-containing protein n=1 Tax=Adiantum capillus-veneris TaxID=13818 RepID=A0A9D4V785_ADICA|nr:hypothetical protein GOP47_0004288 [Adiantum capillus-veneris]